MVYRVMGLMSGSSLDGLDIAFIELHESSGKWSYQLRHAATYPYPGHWVDDLRNAHTLQALDYQLLHTRFGHYIGERVNEFIHEYQLDYQVQLVASHGHTSFHLPAQGMTAQLGDGAAIAAVTGLNVVSDLRALDVALGGHGAPIVPIGEKMLFPQYQAFLNIGGIANISLNSTAGYIAFDICPANRVLNMLAREMGKDYDAGGEMAASGALLPDLLNTLNELDYYRQPYPKSLSNQFGTETVFPILSGSSKTENLLRTYVEHIAVQVHRSVQMLAGKIEGPIKILITGGGAHNEFLVERIAALLAEAGIEVELPSDEVVDFKEAIIMALIGILRWREEYNVLASVTGASRNSIGGAVWMGQEA